MAYFLNLFSPETYEAFSNSSRDTSGFRGRQRNVAENVKPGDILICYITKVSRWAGLLEVISESYEDPTPLFYEKDDPYVIRFKVKPLVWLGIGHAIPIKSDQIWSGLSFTRGYEKEGTSTWTGKLRTSLNHLTKADGELLESALRRQSSILTDYPIDEDTYNKLTMHKVRRENKIVSVTVPEDTEDEQMEEPESQSEVRESIEVQALLAQVGTSMGMKIWAPAQDRGLMVRSWPKGEDSFLKTLPLNYDGTTLKTIEQIDLIWLKGRSIIRAFEVEHTTSIYSGLLRMADLLALQPNMEIKLHIVAPESRREKVFRELQRPVFSLLEKGPLSESCTFLSYDAIREIAKLKHLRYLSDSVLEDYAEVAE